MNPWLQIVTNWNVMAMDLPLSLGNIWCGLGEKISADKSDY